MKLIVIEIKVVKYLNKFRPYLKCIINNLKKSNTWKIQLIIVNNFISIIDSDEERVMDLRINNIEIWINHGANEVIK